MHMSVRTCAFMYMFRTNLFIILLLIKNTN